MCKIAKRHTGLTLLKAEVAFVLNEEFDSMFNIYKAIKGIPKKISGNNCISLKDSICKLVKKQKESFFIKCINV